MANWASGHVKVRGRSENIEKFCELFLFYGREPGKEHFARSFISMNWEDFKKEYLGSDNVEFGVEFAWSCHSCMIEGYPDGRKCVTLIEACRRFSVDVVIDTYEHGLAFEEHIECDRDGDLIEECKDMPVYVCSCGEERGFSTNYDYLDDEECFGCGAVGKWRLK